jgi:fatty-acid peroxygenase
MFLEMMEPPERERMQQVFIEEWNDACRRWQKAGSVILHEELQHLLTRTAMRSAGFDLTANDVESRAFEFSSRIENAGRVGPRNWMARTLRFRTEHRARGVIDSVRDGSMDVPAGSALARLAAQTELDGQLLHSEIAAVELLNTIRLVVAISRFIVFAALCTEQIPRWHALFSSGVEDDLANIVTEVRRHAPFFPVMGGRVRRPFEWHGHRSRRAKGVARPNGTNHDQRIWSEPNRFRPERFRNWPGTPVHADSS